MRRCHFPYRSKSTSALTETSRVSGEMFVECAHHSIISTIETRREPSRLDRNTNTIGSWFYKHSAPTALPILLLLVAVCAQLAYSQRRTAPSSIPSPRAVLGFNPGDDRTIADWKQIGDYFARLDTASDRVQLQTIGKSTLGRPMFVAFISAPENIRNLEKYKDIQRRLADPRLGPGTAGDQSGESLITEGKTIVVISCSIHSTEIVASQMSMELAYQ